MKTLADRIIFLRKTESRALFAERLGIPASTLRNYETGVTLPNSDFIIKICTLTHTDVQWLLFGTTPEYTVQAPSSCPALPVEQSLQFGISTAVSEHMRVFAARSAAELTDSLTRNMPLYIRISFVYYTEEQELEQQRGYYVAVLGGRKDMGIDVYDAHVLCSWDDFFLVELVGVLAAVFRRNLPLYEAYSTGKAMRETLGTALVTRENTVPEHVEQYFFKKQVDVPTILYGFQQTS